jgi:hypothetical protein
MEVQFGSLWPFGGSWVREEDALQTFLGPSDERIEHSWEPKPVLIVNHLSKTALRNYSKGSHTKHINIRPTKREDSARRVRRIFFFFSAAQ